MGGMQGVGVKKDAGLKAAATTAGLFVAPRGDTEVGAEAEAIDAELEGGAVAA